jgi:sodium-dependent dicarboxylate transporter 2/3/5
MATARIGSRQLGLVLGVALFAVVLALPPLPPFRHLALETVSSGSIPLDPSLLATSLQSVSGLLLLMVTWWVTEAVPLPATALLPAFLLPLLHVVGVSGEAPFEFTFRNTVANYASPVIYLFLGGFLLAAAMQKWGVDRRITLWILTRGRLAESSRAILFAMMGVTALLSMWISNTACAAMMLPLGLGVLKLMDLQPGSSRFGLAMMLGIAWAASIGGVGTIIGTPPNGIALGILQTTLPEEASRITFLDWMKFGVPYVVLMVPVAWMVLIVANPPEVRALPGGKSRLEMERSKLGPPRRGEWMAAGVFLAAVALWVTNPFWQMVLPSGVAGKLEWVDEYTIGLLAGAVCLLLPVDLRVPKFLLDWKDTLRVDWGTLILFGGGIALSDAMFKTGLAGWIATSLVGAVGSPSTVVLAVVIVLLADFLTEITSNTAVTGMLVPVVISVALSTGADPVTLVVATALAASMAFMLPVATPPNALVYGTGYVSIRQMVRNGFVLDLLGWLMTIAVLAVFGGYIFRILEF